MIAFLFPGQGSQAVGMGRGFYDASPAARAIFDEANDALGFDLARLAFDGPEAELALPANPQPAVLTVSVAAAAVAAERGMAPALASGHSLGEYSALVVAGALAFPDAVRIVRSRGEFMQDAVPVGTGAMAAIMGLELAQVEVLCAETARGEVVEVANVNSPQQIVIAGHRAAVERAVALAADRGGKKSVMLPVSAPFHCALMRPAAERLATMLADVTILEPKIPVVRNVDGGISRTGAEVKDALLRQVASPVRWTACVQRLAAAGATTFVEVGPGRVLSALVKRIVEGARGEDCDRLVDTAKQRFGRLDVLVNNAGITRDGLLVRMKDDDWDRVMETNLRGAFLMTRAAAKVMMRQKAGRIINIASVAGAMGNPGQANYSAAKAGLIGLTKSTARELAHWSILVNAVAPGPIETDMSAAIPEAAREALLAQVPLGRIGTAREVAEVVRFLAGDGAAYITGQVLHVNGGLYI